MTVYLLNILITAIVALAAGRVLKYKKISGKNQKIPIIFIIIILIIWVAIYSLRGASVGSDTSGYMYSYDMLRYSKISFFDAIAQGDKLFEAIRYICNKVSDSSWLFFAATIAIITYLPVLITIRKETGQNFAIAVLIYIFLLHFYTGFNAMRQAAAISVTFFSYTIFFKEKKYVQYILGMIFAWGLHSTAILMIFFHFMSKLKLTSKSLWIIIFLLLGSVISAQSLWDNAITLLSLTGNDILATRYSDNMYKGSGYLRILVCFMPVFFGIWKYKILKKYDEQVDSYIILLIFDMIFMTFSTTNWLFARIAYYFDIYAVLFIPQLKNIFSANSREIAIVIICIMYFVYMVVLLLHGEAALYPYYFNDL